MIALLLTIATALQLYVYVIIAMVIFSWLVAFNIVNMSNPIVSTIGNLLHQLTEPVLSRIRRYMPDLGTIDLSPIVLLLGIYFLRLLIFTSLIPAIRG